MRVDADKSVHHEAEGAKAEFDKDELHHARLLLRRLRFLEAQVRDKGGLSRGNGSGGAAFAEWEALALEWVLTEIGFLSERENQ